MHHWQVQVTWITVQNPRIPFFEFFPTLNTFQYIIKKSVHKSKFSVKIIFENTIFIRRIKNDWLLLWYLEIFSGAEVLQIENYLFGFGPLLDSRYLSYLKNHKKIIKISKNNHNNQINLNAKFLKTILKVGTPCIFVHCPPAGAFCHIVPE